MDVTSALQSQNRCLQKLLADSSDFLNLSEQNLFNSLQGFQTKRDVLIKTIHIYDQKITHMISELSTEEKDKLRTPYTRDLISSKERLIQNILKTDEKIMSKLELEKARIKQALTESSRNHEIFRKFKSNWIAESGERLDGSL